MEDSDEKKGESLLASTPVVVLSAILGRTPTIDEYKQAVKGIDLTKFAHLAKASPRLSTRLYVASRTRQLTSQAQQILSISKISTSRLRWYQITND